VLSLTASFPPTIIHHNTEKGGARPPILRLTNLNPNTAYTFEIQAVNASGKASVLPSINVKTLSSPDTERPSGISMIKATSVSKTAAKILWSAATDNVAVIGYKIYANGNLVGETTNLEYQLTGLNPLTKYYIKVVAEDEALNTSLIPASLEITTGEVYQYSGVLQPINADGTSLFKAGSTIPVKFTLKDYSGAYVSTAKATISYAKLTNNGFGTDVKATSISAATIGNVFRYDSTSNQYIFNMSTKGFTAGTYRLTITLDDGKSYPVQINLK
jgi:chitodextrinase